MRALWRNAGFRLLFIGLFTSMTGDWLLMLVLGIWVKELTGSSGAAGLTFFFSAAPSLLAPAFGAVVDRFRRRPFLVATNLASAAMLTPLAFVHDAGDVWLIYLTAVAYGCSQILHGGALNGLLKVLLPEHQLVDANGWLHTVRQGLRLFGPLAGAGLFALYGGAFVAAVDAVSFLVAAGLIAAMRVREDKPERAAREHWQAEVTAGARHLFADPALRRAVLSFTFTTLMLGMMESAGFALNDEGLHREPEFISVLVSCMGVGAIAGGLLAAPCVRRFGELAVIGAVIGVEGLTTLVVVVPLLPTVLLAFAVAGFVMPIGPVAGATLLQRRTPNALMGRVSAAYEAMVGAPTILSVGVGAVLVSVVDYRLLLPVMAVVLFAAGAYAWRGRALTVPVDNASTGRSRTPA